MRRKVVHLTFGAIALACAAIAAHQGLRLREAVRINEAIASARVSEFDANIPQARLARAAALARAGDSDAAITAYKSLIADRRGELRRDALYNVGNLYLRNALASRDWTKTLPLVELAKQSYRDVLRADPTDWDARYNLELALRLAPEIENELEEKEEPPEREQSTSTLQGVRIDLP